MKSFCCLLTLYFKHHRPGRGGLLGHSLNGYRLCQKQSELGDFEERSPIIRGIRYAVIFAGTGTWRPSRRALYYPSRACTMNVGIIFFAVMR